MAFPPMGSGLAAVREARTSLAALDRSAPAGMRQPMLASDGSQDTIVSLQPDEHHTLPKISDEALGDLREACAAIDNKRTSCCDALCCIPGSICACISGFCGLLVDLFCEGCSNGLACMKSCASNGFRCCVPSKEDQKQMLINAKKAEWQISVEQEHALLG